MNEIAKRRKPPSNREIALYGALSAVLLALSIFFLVRRGLGDLSPEFFFLPLALLFLLYELIAKGSDRNVLRRSAEITTAKILDTRVEEKREFLSKTARYYATIEFTASQTDDTHPKQVKLEAQVSKEVFDRLGKQCRVQYARENPAVAFLEGEFSEE